MAVLFHNRWPEADNKMVACCYSFCCGSSFSRQYQTSPPKSKLCARSKVDNAVIYMRDARQLCSTRGTMFARACNIDRYSSEHSSHASNLAKRMAEARDMSRKSVSARSMPDLSSIYFSDDTQVACTDVDSTTTVQELRVPDAPHKWGLPIWQVTERVRTFLRHENIPVAKRDQLEKDMILLLAAVRGWISQLADAARQISTPESKALQNNREPQVVDAFITLLQMAGFAVLPDPPELPEPHNSDALALGSSAEKTLDPTILQGSTAVEEHIRRNGIQLGAPLHYPYLLIATRGVTAVRRSGLLLPQKLRAIERTYFGWIRSPIAWLLEGPLLKFSKVRNMGFGSRTSGKTSDISTRSYRDVVSVRTDYAVHPSDHRMTVRRIVPAVKLTGSWDSLRQLFLPTLTQEPAHEHMILMFREVVPDKVAMLREQRKALIDQMKESLSQAINPIPPGRKKAARAAMDAEASDLQGFQKPIGETKPISLVMFGSVPWGTMDHLFPSTFVLPATRDLLRIDALTFTGLVSALVTYLQNAENAVVYGSLIASVASYCVRVVLGLRQALVGYRGRITSQKADALISKQRACLDSLTELAVEEMFVDAACVWLSGHLSHLFTPQQMQKRIFEGFSLTDETVHLWKDWLYHNGFWS